MAKILLVEDDFYIRGLYKTLLEKAGHQVSEASDGRALLEILGKEPPPDLLLLDLMLPEVSGVEALRRIRSHPVWKDLPVVVLTNVDTEPLIKEVVGLGVEKYFVKADIPIRELAERIEPFLKKS